MTDQFAKLSPRDVVITIRSLARRFDEVSGAARSDPDLFQRLDAPGPGGRSLPDIVVRASQELILLGNEIDRLIDRTEPVVPRAAIDPTQRHFDQPPGRGTMTDAAAAIADEAGRVGERLDRLEAPEWGRTAAVAGGGEVSLLDLAREMARTGVGELRAAQEQLRWLRETS